jgi:Rod binding domain-containing protein
MSIPITRVGQLPQAFATPATNSAASATITGAGMTAPVTAPTAGAAMSATGSGATALGTAAGAHAPKDARTAKLEKAAGEFEQIFVKQLLKEAKVGGSEKQGGYGDMAVDALASGVQKGGGLGLAKQIEAALAAHHQTSSTGGATTNPASPTSPPLSTAPLQPATRAAKR